MISHRKFLDTCIIVEQILTENGITTTNEDHVYRSFDERYKLRITVSAFYKTRSQEKTSPAIIIEDETDNSWARIIFFEKMSEDTLRSVFCYELKEFFRTQTKGA